MQRRPLTRLQSLLLVLLRQRLLEFDRQPELGTRLMLSARELREMLTPFVPETTNEVSWRNRLDALIGKVKDLGFLSPVRGSEADSFEVKRVIKAKISADELATMRHSLLAEQGEMQAEDRGLRKEERSAQEEQQGMSE